jgi:hypothetical protein
MDNTHCTGIEMIDFSWDTHLEYDGYRKCSTSASKYGDDFLPLTSGSLVV